MYLKTNIDNEDYIVILFNGIQKQTIEYLLNLLDENNFNISIFSENGKVKIEINKLLK